MIKEMSHEKRRKKTALRQSYIWAEFFSIDQAIKKGRKSVTNIATD